MKIENMATAKVGELTARITRARAVASRVYGGIPLSGALKQQDHRRVLRSKRAAVDELKNHAPIAAGGQHKRRAVLKDVTNICCDSYNNCLIAPKLPKKNIKQPMKGSLNITKFAPSITAHRQQLPVDSKTQVSQETLKTKHKPSEVEFLVKFQSNLQCETEVNGKECNIDNPQLEKQNTEVPPQLQNFSNRDKVNLYGKLISGNPLNPDISDIDSDHKNSQLCSLYAPDIYSNLRVLELMRKPCTDFMETVQRDITDTMRGILVDWLVEVAEEYKLVPDTLYLTVHFIDLFLSENYIERQKLQLLGITCMSMASKYEEICAPRVEEFCFITDNTYTREEVLKMESRVLNYLRFQLSAPTAKTFLRRFLRAAQACYKTPSLELEYLANYLAELALVDYEFLKFLPSIIAASAVFLARWTLDQLGHPWNPTLEHYTDYKASDLRNPVLALRGLQQNTNGCPLNAIRGKYRQEKFNSVAALSSPELLETLF